MLQKILRIGLVWICFASPAYGCIALRARLAGATVVDTPQMVLVAGKGTREFAAYLREGEKFVGQCSLAEDHSLVWGNGYKKDKRHWEIALRLQAPLHEEVLWALFFHGFRKIGAQTIRVKVEPTDHILIDVLENMFVVKMADARLTPDHHHHYVWDEKLWALEYRE